MKEVLDRPWASEETERRVRATFPVELAPAEFAARDGDGWLDFPFANFRYRDAALDAWICEVARVLRDPKLIREAQQRYLTPAEHMLMLRLRSADDDDDDDED